MQTATENAQRPAEPAAAPPMFRLARSKQVIDVTDETVLAWHAKPDSGIKMYRIGNVVMVETATVLDFIRRHPMPPRPRLRGSAEAAA